MKSNFPAENPGLHHFSQVIKANITSNACQYNVLFDVIPHFTVYYREGNPGQDLNALHLYYSD